MSTALKVREDDVNRMNTFNSIVDDLAFLHREAGEFSEAEQIAQLISDSESKIFSLICTASVAATIKKGEPLKILENAFTAAIWINNPFLKCKALSDIAKAYKDLGYSDLSTDTFIIAEKIATKISNETSVFKNVTLRYIAENYRSAGDPCKAEELLKSLVPYQK
jgi:hypothetical protein